MVRGSLATVLAVTSLGCSTLPAPVAASRPNQAPHLVTPRADAGDAARSERPEIGLPVQPGLTREERARLEGGWLVPRPMRFTDQGQAYVGGVSYQLVRATPREVLASLEPSASLQRVLPLAQEVTLVDRTPEVRSLRVTHGKAFVSVAYTVDVTRGHDAYRFWLDGEEENDIRDVWGYMKVAQYDADRSLITVGVALDLGPGIVRTLFEDRVRDGMLATAARIREFVEAEPAVVASRAAMTQAW